MRKNAIKKQLKLAYEFYSWTLRTILRIFRKQKLKEKNHICTAKNYGILAS